MLSKMEIYLKNKRFKHEMLKFHSSHRKEVEDKNSLYTDTLLMFSKRPVL